MIQGSLIAGIVNSIEAPEMMIVCISISTLQEYGITMYGVRPACIARSTCRIGKKEDQSEEE
jgi:hypothetical protein